MHFVKGKGESFTSFFEDKIRHFQNTSLVVRGEANGKCRK